MNAISLFGKDAGGKPITGAQVDVGLFMPQMGAVPPMSSKATLMESGNGIYTGQVEFQMAWTWQATVTARKNAGQWATRRECAFESQLFHSAGESAVSSNLLPDWRY